MKRPIRLLALDLDGTVLNSDKQITPVTHAALEAAIAAGVTVIPASGRPLFGLCPEFLSIPGVDYVLTSNGAAVHRLSDGARIHTDNLSDAAAIDLMERLLPLDVAASFFLGDRSYLPARQQPLMEQMPMPKPIMDYLHATRTPLEDPVGFIRQRGGVQKFSINFLHNSDGSWRDGQQVRDILADYPDLSVVSGGVDNLEITSPTANKGNALLALAAYLGIPREEVMACGDSENDLAMLKAAGFAVAMANSEPCVLPYADAVTASNDEDGVARAIEAYIL